MAIAFGRPLAIPGTPNSGQSRHRVKLFPAGTAGEEQRAIFLNSTGSGQSAGRWDKRRAIARQLSQIGLGETTDAARRITSRSMKSRDALLFQDQDIGYTPARQMVSGRGAGETGADNDIVKIVSW